MKKDICKREQIKEVLCKSIGIFVVYSCRCQSFKVGSFITLRYGDNFHHGVILRRCFLNCPSVTLLSDLYLGPCMEKDNRYKRVTTQTTTKYNTIQNSPPYALLALYTSPLLKLRKPFLIICKHYRFHFTSSCFE